MAHLDNPAGRLEALLAAFREQGPGNSTHVHQAWVRVLRIPEGDFVELGRHMGLILMLPGQIRTQIEAIEGINHERLLRHLPEAEAALSNSVLNMGAGMVSVTSQYNDRTVYSLESCSDELHLRRNESEISEEQLSEIANKTRELIDYVLDSYLEPDFKEFLIKHLRAIEYALQEVRIRGADALVEVVDRFFGAVLRQGLWERLTKVEPIFTMLSTLVATISLAGQVAIPALSPAPASTPSVQPAVPEIRIQQVTETAAVDGDIVDAEEVQEEELQP